MSKHDTVKNASELEDYLGIGSSDLAGPEFKIKLIKLSEKEIETHNNSVDEPNWMDGLFIQRWAGECFNCGFDKIPSQNYLMKFYGDLEDQDFHLIEKTIKKLTGCENYIINSYQIGEVLSVSKCPKCKSEEIHDLFD